MFYVLSKLGFLVLRPSNGLILAMGVGLLLRWTVLKRRGAQLFGLAFALLVISAWTGLGSLLLRPLENRFAAPVDVARLAPKGIIVLGGVLDNEISTERGRGEFTEAADRLLAAAELARRFPSAEVIFTGGSAGLSDYDLVPEADSARKSLLELGVAPERILLERRARNTLENARFTLDFVQPQPGDRWILVTSAFHMPRAAGTFRAAGWSGLVPWPVDYRTLSHTRVLEQQSASDGLKLTDLAVKEWIGLAAYRFAGYTDALFPAP